MSGRRQIALMGGSYNPVHAGHMMVAQYVQQWCAGIDEVRLMLSPMNPLKDGCGNMASDADKLAMLDIAVRASDGTVGVCDIELSMPRPSYSIDTLDRLSRENPDSSFRLVIGSDNWNCFDRWRAADRIIRQYGLIVYPRPGYRPRPVPADCAGRVTLIDAPVCGISSTMVREAVALGRRVNYFLPAGVWDYIEKHNLYRTNKI